MRSRNSYIYRGFPEPKRSNNPKSRDPLPFLLKPLGSKRSHVTLLIQSLKDTELIESFGIFDHNLQTMNLQTGKADSGNSLIIQRWNYIRESLMNPLYELFSRNSPTLNKKWSFLLTYSLLYDYLVEGKKFLLPIKNTENFDGIIKENKYFLTDYLVEMLQAGLVMEYKIKKAFNNKCTEMNLSEEDCPIFDPLENSDDPREEFQVLLEQKERLLSIQK